MLATETVRKALRGEGRIGAKILEHKPHELCVSSITVAELRYGAEHSGSQKLSSLIDTFVGSIEVVDFDENSARQFGTLAMEMAKRGTAIGEFEMLVAAHAIGVEATLVTDNADPFARVFGLYVENWT